jgi:hypothetical protein
MTLHSTRPLIRLGSATVRGGFLPWLFHKISQHLILTGSLAFIAWLLKQNNVYFYVG